MFDISFSEILVIATVALIVLGPERLPKVARTLGHLFGRAQRYVNDVRNDIQREMELEELKKWKTSIEETGRTVENSVRTEAGKLQEAVQEAKSEFSTTSGSSSQPSQRETEAAPHDSSELPGRPAPDSPSGQDAAAAGARRD